MSLLQELDDLSHFKSFSLGFYKFFKQFNVIEINREQFFCWNEKILLSRAEAKDYIEYVEAQLKWIEEPEVQCDILMKGRDMRFVCQRKITFFVQKLHEKVGQGYDGKAHYYLRDIRNLAQLSLMT